ncbi:hypothetical protein JZ751_018471, partial [Albula glossodonta]
TQCTIPLQTPKGHKPVHIPIYKHLRWFCEGRELHHCPDIQISRDADLHTLVIAEAFEDDTGRYTCVASNRLGADNTSAEVYIEAPPVFTKSLQDAQASEGQVVVLECRVRGSPSLHVRWYREGEEIQDSPDFRILQKKPRSAAEPEEICTLVIAEAFPEDGGMFSCSATNNYGSVTSTAQLTVHPVNEDSVSNGVSVDSGLFEDPQAFPPPPPPTEISLLELPPKPPGSERFHVNELEIWPSMPSGTDISSHEAIANGNPSSPPPPATKQSPPPSPPSKESPPPTPPSHVKDGPPLPTKPKPKL